MGWKYLVLVTTLLKGGPTTRESKSSPAAIWTSCMGTGHGTDCEDPRPKVRYFARAILTLQYNMIGRIDDTCKTKAEDLKPNAQFPFCLLGAMAVLVEECFGTA